MYFSDVSGGKELPCRWLWEPIGGTYGRDVVLYALSAPVVTEVATPDLQ